MTAQLAIGDHPGAPVRVLCVGAHSDDIEIGCGGTIMRLLREHPESSVRWVVFSADDHRESEARASAADFLVDAGETEVIVHRFDENFFPADWASIKRAISELRDGPSPDIVLTHRRDDLHQDHRTLAEFTWNTFREHLVLEYEIPKYEGDLGQPNLFVPLDPAIAERKVDLLIRHFGSQRGRTWFRADTFRGLMAVRAVECAAPGGFAEAFYARKLVL